MRPLMRALLLSLLAASCTFDVSGAGNRNLFDSIHRLRRAPRVQPEGSAMHASILESAIDECYRRCREVNISWISYIERSGHSSICHCHPPSYVESFDLRPSPS